MKVITIVLIALILGIGGGIFAYPKFFRPKKESTISIFRQTVQVKHLQLIEQFYQNLVAIHKKNDPNKRLLALFTIPVRVSSYIDLNALKIDSSGDTITKITIPNPQIDTPILFEYEHIEQVKIPGAFIHIGAGQMNDFVATFKSQIQQESDKMIAKATGNGILDLTREGAKNYINSLLNALKIYNVTLENEPAGAQGIKLQSGGLIDSVGLKSIP